MEREGVIVREVRGSRVIGLHRSQKKESQRMSRVFLGLKCGKDCPFLLSFLNLRTCWNLMFCSAILKMEEEAAVVFVNRAETEWIRWNACSFSSSEGGLNVWTTLWPKWRRLTNWPSADHQWACNWHFFFLQKKTSRHWRKKAEDFSMSEWTTATGLQSLLFVCSFLRFLFPSLLFLSLPLLRRWLPFVN